MISGAPDPKLTILNPKYRLWWYSHLSFDGINLSRHYILRSASSYQMFSGFTGKWQKMDGLSNLESNNNYLESGTNVRDKTTHTTD